MKPTGGASGSGTTTGVRTREQLLRARLRGARVGRRLLIERQAEGDMYRFLFCDGELLDAVRRRPPRVTGDGRSTIRELIAAENASRLDPAHPVSMPILRVDLDCLFSLEAAGLSLRSVLPEGQTVAVKTVTSQNRIEDNETVREPVAPELVEEARSAAAQVGVRLAGVDLITTDLSRSLKEVRRRDNRGQRDSRASLSLPGRRSRKCHPRSGPDPAETARRAKEITPP